MLDLFTFRTHLKDAPATKRGILRLASLVFDPLGFLTPFILLAKLLLQELWRLEYDWDQDISDDLAKTWRNWVLAAENITAVKIQRCYNLDDRPVNEIQLHVFAMHRKRHMDVSHMYGFPSSQEVTPVHSSCQSPD